MNQVYTKSVIGIGSLIDRFNAPQCSSVNLDPKVGDLKKKKKTKIIGNNTHEIIGLEIIFLGLKKDDH